MKKQAFLLVVSVLVFVSLTVSIPSTISNTINSNPEVFAQSSVSTDTSNNTTSSSSTDIASSGNQSNATSGMSIQQLNDLMKQLASSDKPDDIATLAYIYGFPLVSVMRTIDYTTNPNLPAGPGRGPENTFNHFRNFPNASFTDIVRPNVDTLYSNAYIDLKNSPLVLQVPPIAGRYYSLQFVDAYSNNFLYIGSRLNDTSGGVYLLSGPNWEGTVPPGMTEIKSPTNDIVVGLRVFVKDPQDVGNVHTIQDRFLLTPLSVFQSGQALTNTTSRVQGAESNVSKSLPPAPDPALIPATGIKIYDEIGMDMAANPPPQNDSAVVTKFETIEIGPGKATSTQTNGTIQEALKTGIAEGEKLIDAKIKVLGANVNGWDVLGMIINGSNTSIEMGNYGTDYLMRAAVAKYGLFGASPEEAVYPGTFTDSQGQNLTGANSYVIHFEKGQTPPVNAFWSITMYDNASRLVNNPIDRYSISDRTPGIKFNEDGSLDFYIQHDSPGPDKESNWLPAPEGNFSMNLRLYVPQESILNGEYQYPPVQRVS